MGIFAVVWAHLKYPLWQREGVIRKMELSSRRAQTARAGRGRDQHFPCLDADGRGSGKSCLYLVALLPSSSCLPHLTKDKSILGFSVFIKSPCTLRMQTSQLREGLWTRRTVQRGWTLMVLLITCRDSALRTQRETESDSAHRALIFLHLAHNKMSIMSQGMESIQDIFPTELTGEIQTDPYQI